MTRKQWNPDVKFPDASKVVDDVLRLAQDPGAADLVVQKAMEETLRAAECVMGDGWPVKDHKEKLRMLARMLREDNFGRSRRGAKLPSAEQFRVAFVAECRTCGQTTVELARKLNVSPATIRRWSSGLSAPAPLGRAPVLFVLRGGSTE